jgi:hypothetical protein
MFDITFIRTALIGLLGMLAASLPASATTIANTAGTAEAVRPSESRAAGYQQWADYAPYYLFAVSANYLESPFDSATIEDRGEPAGGD